MTMFSTHYYGCICYDILFSVVGGDDAGGFFEYEPVSIIISHKRMGYKDRGTCSTREGGNCCVCGCLSAEEVHIGPITSGVLVHSDTHILVLTKA